MVRYEVDGFGVNKDFRIDFKPDLDGNLEEIEARDLRSFGGRR